jgi:hypothetical protein
LLEATSTLKITLNHQDGVWCENIIVPELKLLANAVEDDHLVITIEQKGKSGADLTVYFSCVPKGRLHIPYSLREMIEKVKHSKVKLYHGDDLEIRVNTLLYATLLYATLRYSTLRYSTLLYAT